jgi:hypothetical protein
LREKQGFVERLIASCFAFGPQGAEFGHIPLNGAVDALLVESEKQEIVVLGEPSAGLDEGIFDEKLGWVFGCRDAGIEAEQTLQASGEDTGFDGAGTLEAPAVFSNGLGDIDFEGADGGEGFADAFAVRVEGGLLSGSEKVDLTGEAVFVGIETSALRAGLASGSGSGFLGKLGVVPRDDVGYCLLFVKHW